MEKTNVIRLLEQAGVPCRAVSYAYDENDLNGLHAAEGIGMPAAQVLKTLVARGEKRGPLVFCIPVCCELDLKKAARAAGDKRVELVHVKDLLGLTGYIRGGCSPVGMKKKYPTYLDESARSFDEVAVSAGKRGCQVILAPGDLARCTGADFAGLTL